MQFNEEQIRKAIAAKSAEELLEMAKAEGFSLTEEEAEHYFEVLHADPADAECIELSEEEQVNGGLIDKRFIICPNCGVRYFIFEFHRCNPEYGVTYMTVP